MSEWGLPVDLLVLTETHHMLSGDVIQGYRTAPDLQSPPFSVASGGVAIALSSCCSLLGSHVADFFVAAALHVQGIGRLVVAGVYIPPAGSQWYHGSYGDHIDRIFEAVATLGL